MASATAELKILTKARRCAVCSEPMVAGDAFEWHDRGSRYGSAGRGILHRGYAPRHAHACELDMVARQKEERRLRQKEQDEATIQMIADLAPPERREEIVASARAALLRQAA